MTSCLFSAVEIVIWTETRACKENVASGLLLLSISEPDVWGLCFAYVLLYLAGRRPPSRPTILEDQGSRCPPGTSPSPIRSAVPQAFKELVLSNQGATITQYEDPVWVKGASETHGVRLNTATRGGQLTRHFYSFTSNCVADKRDEDKLPYCHKKKERKGKKKHLAPALWLTRTRITVGRSRVPSRLPETVCDSCGHPTTGIRVRKRTAHLP